MNRWWNLFVILILLLLPPLLLWPSFPLWGVSALEDDLIYYFPQRWLLGQYLSAGTWPLWNPYVGMGYPFLGDPQSAVLYPLNWLFAVLPVWFAYPADFCLHFSLAGLGFYLFARATGCMRQAALLGAVAFMFCGFLVGHRVHLTMQNAAAWLPWMLWATSRMIAAIRLLHRPAEAQLPQNGDAARRQLARWIGVYALLAALQFLAGHAQIAFYAHLFCAAYLLVFTRFNWRAFVALAMSAVLMLLLVAPQLLATWQLLQQCARTSAPFSQLAENSLIPVYLILWVTPWFFGTRTPNFYTQPWWGHWHWCEMIGYVGLLTVLVGLWAAWRFLRQDRMIAFLTGAGLFALVLAMGDTTPVYGWLWELVRYLPMVGGLRCPARWLLIVNLAQAMLLARGLHHLWHDADPRSAPALACWLRRGCLALAVGVTLLLTVGAVWIHQPGLAERLGARPSDLEPIKQGLSAALVPLNPALWVPLLLLMLTAMLAPYVVRRDNSLRRWWVLLILLVVDLASVVPFADMSGWGDHRRIASGRQFLEEPLGRFLNAEASQPPHTETPSSATSASSVSRPETSSLPLRLFPLIGGAYGDPLAALIPGTNQLYGVQTVTTYGPLQRRVERRVWNTALWAVPQDRERIAWQTELLNRLSVEYVFSDSPELGPANLYLGAAAILLGEKTWSELESRLLVRDTQQKWIFNREEPLLVGGPNIPSAFLLLEVRSRNPKPQGRLVITWQAGASDPVRWFFIEPEELHPGLRRLFFVSAPSGSNVGELAVRSMDGAEADVRAGLFAPMGVTTQPAGPSGAKATAFCGLWQMRQAYPRAYVAFWAQEFSDPLHVADRLVVGDTGPLPARPSTPGRRENKNESRSCFLAQGVSDTPVPVERYEANRVTIRVKAGINDFSSQPQLLVLNEAYDPGWQVEVNGKNGTVVNVNALVRGVWLKEPGAVVFTYRPLGWPWSFWLTGAGWGGLFLLWIGTPHKVRMQDPGK